jgi:hypothetical protein
MIANLSSIYGTDRSQTSLSSRISIHVLSNATPDPSAVKFLRLCSEAADESRANGGTCVEDGGGKGQLWRC